VNNVARPITITNEWQRYEYTAVASGTSGQIGIQLATSGDEVMICHAQAELGAASTSPIYGTEGGLVTRNADIELTVETAGLLAAIVSTGLTMYAEFGYLPAVAGGALVGIGNSAAGLGGKGIGCYLRADSLKFAMEILDDVSARTRITSIDRAAGKNKIIVRYNPAGTFDFFGNGVKSTHTSAVTPVTTITAANVVRFPSLINVAFFQANFSLNKYYHILSLLSDAQCIQLTTL